MKITDIQGERTFNNESLKSFIAELHPIFQECVSYNRQPARAATERGELPNFT